MSQEFFSVVFIFALTVSVTAAADERLAQLGVKFNLSGVLWYVPLTGLLWYLSTVILQESFMQVALDARGFDEFSLLATQLSRAAGLYNTSFLVAFFVTLFIFYNLLLNRPAVICNQACVYLVLLAIVSMIFMSTTNLVTLLVCFECLLLLALGLLKLTSKSERIGEAVSEMFM
jgi:NADH:ubiquinone oxidoreductase subunit 2 (subunit N)